MIIKQLCPDNYSEALTLVEEVFMQYDAPTYPQSSIDEFIRSIHDPSYINILTLYAAFNDDNEIMGVLATRKEGTHIALFFVKEKFQRQGVGRALFNTARMTVPNTCMTVFSSRYALDIYRHLGFVQTDSEQCDRGVYFTPFIFANDSISTDRLYLRSWQESDADRLFFLAQSHEVGPIAGWPPHKNADESLNVIRNVFNSPLNFAIVLRATDEVIGCIGLMRGLESNLKIADNEAELGFWLGRDYWNNGYMTEAVSALIEYGFHSLNLSGIWSGYFEGNSRSAHVQEKCGFKYVRTDRNIYWPLMNDIRTEIITYKNRDKESQLA